MHNFILLTILLFNCFIFAQSVNQYQYDNLNRLSRIDYPDGTSITYSYDPVGNRSSRTITALTAPAANFAAAPTSGEAPLTVQFSDQSTPGSSSISGWQWDFDNNGTVDATGAGPHQFVYNNPGSYSVKLTVSDGSLMDEELKIDYITVSSGGIMVNVKAFLEGPFNAGTMTTTLKDNAFLPLSQPFGSAPWNYTGSENVTEIPTDVVDWVLLEIRSGITAKPHRSMTQLLQKKTGEISNLAATLGFRAAFIKNNGMIVDLDGSSEVAVSQVTAGQYYVVVHHRNHLSIMSAAAATFSNQNSPLYDFTTGSNQYYGGGAIELSPGVWGMIAGDADATGTVDANDRAATWNDRNINGYQGGDCNLSGTVDANDRAITWNNRNRTSTIGTTNFPQPGILLKKNNLDQ